MKKLILLPLLIISLFTFGQETKTYDHVCVMQVAQDVRITMNDNEFRVEKFNEKVEGNGDYRPAFHWIKKYEEDGWTLYNIDYIVTGTYTLIAILRKENKQ